MEDDATVGASSDPPPTTAATTAQDADNWETGQIGKSAGGSHQASRGAYVPNSTSQVWMRASRSSRSTLTLGDCSGVLAAFGARTVSDVVTCSRVGRVPSRTSVERAAVVRGVTAPRANC